MEKCKTNHHVNDVGNKLTAYGGNLTVFHRALFNGPSVEDSEVILKGNGLELHYGLGAGPFTSGMEQRSKFTLKVEKVDLKEKER